jgi:hypothetical protein
MRTIRCSTGEVVNSYKEYLNTKHWLDKRSQVFESNGYECSKCKSKKQLHIHHKTYVRIGREKLKDLVVLCKSCHDREHYILDNKDYFYEKTKPREKTKPIKTPKQLEMEARKRMGRKQRKIFKEKQKAEANRVKTKQEIINEKYGLL